MNYKMASSVTNIQNLEKSKFHFDDIFLHILDIRSINQSDIDKVNRILPKRYLRANKFLHKDDMLRCIGAGMLLIEDAKVTNENDLKVDSNGKPKIKGETFFNLSHSGNYVVIAVASHEVGVDIEKVDQKNLSIAREVFTPNEIKWMNKDQFLRFHILWTQKESVVKLDGRGLSINTLNFEVNQSKIFNTTELYTNKIKIFSFVYDNCVLSTASYSYV